MKIMRMKVLLLLCISLIVVFINVSSQHLSEHDVVGVDSQKKWTDLMKKALVGLSKVLRTGDDTLGIPAMDPYEVSNFVWNYDDDLGTKLELTCPGTAILEGLSDLKIYSPSLDIRDLKFRIAFDVKTLVLESPYKIEGVIKNILPVFGQGIAKFKAKDVYFHILGSLSMKNSVLDIDEVESYTDIFDSRMEIDLPDLMDLPTKFSERIVSDVISKFSRYSEINKVGDKLVRDWLEKNVVGKTLGEALEPINHLAKKAD